MLLQRRPLSIILHRAHIVDSATSVYVFTHARFKLARWTRPLFSLLLPRHYSTPDCRLLRLQSTRASPRPTLTFSSFPSHLRAPSLHTTDTGHRTTDLPGPNNLAIPTSPSPSSISSLHLRQLVDVPFSSLIDCLSPSFRYSSTLDSSILLLSRPFFLLLLLPLSHFSRHPSPLFRLPSPPRAIYTAIALLLSVFFFRL